jgi:integrase
MTIKFYLRSEGDNAPVYAYITWAGFRYRYCTDINVNSLHWNATSGRAQVVHGYPASIWINKRIDELRSSIEVRYNEWIFQSHRHPSLAEMKKICGQSESTSNTECALVDYAKKYVQSMSTKTNKRTGVVLAPVTINKHNQVIECLKAFECAHSKVLLSEAGTSFYKKFVAFLTASGYAVNTIGKFMSIIRSWLREGDASGLSVNPGYKSSDWYIGREKVDHVSLSLDELNRIAQLQLIGQMDAARDLFIISAYTGLRYSDVCRINDGVINNGFITIEQKKTLQTVTLPLLPVVAEIVSKYRHGNRVYMPHVSNVIMNRLLKDIGKLANISDDVVTRRTVGGVREVKTRPKYMMITTHTARRSFAKNLFMTGFNLSWISQLMGHHNEAQTLEYIAVDAMEKARLLQKHWG